ncbi:MAG TPA: 30S ribosomal protein S1 [Candidatus Acidoferrales bacterium]|nr:30S ribosomal protein S1 [Candidatus Acidoferrales bacterium]
MDNNTTENLTHSEPNEVAETTAVPAAEAPPAASAEPHAAASAVVETPVVSADHGDRAAASAAGGETAEPVRRKGAAKEPSESESMDALLEQYAAEHEAPADGDVLEGRIVAVTDLGVVVDLGSKFEALIPAQELTDAKGSMVFELGASVPVMPLHEEKEGYKLVSFLRAFRKRAWEAIEKAHRNHESITGKITERIRGGLVVDVGVPAFLPASQVDLRPVREFDGWVGQDITCRILKMNRKRGNVVLSRRVLLEEELKAQRDAAVATIEEGSIVRGKVKNITDYGVFVDLGGVDGLLHLTDISWGRVTNPAEVMKVGDEVEAKVLKFDREKMRISLGRKQLVPDPWVNVPERFKGGQRLIGKVVGITDYGAFVELDPGVEGLVHVSEMTWSKRAKHPSKIVALGDELEVEILKVDPEQRRISLGMKQTLPDPWLTLRDKYPIGTIVTGRVRSMTDFGAFVEVEEGVEGLVHISDIRWTEKPKHPSEALRKGETVEAKVLKIDMENRRLSLGIKQVHDIWADWAAAHKIGEVVKGKVLRLANFGAFVELAAGIEGLCHISEIEERKSKNDRQQPQRKDRDKGGEAASPLTVGSEYDFKIVKKDPEQRRIGLSYRGALQHEERKVLQEYRSSKSSRTATIGDILMSKREASN